MTRTCGTCGWDWDKADDENRAALDKRIEAVIERIPPEQRVVPLASLTPEERRLVLALVAAKKSADEKKEEEGA